MLIAPTPAPTNNLNNDDDSPTMMDEGRMEEDFSGPPSDKPQTATSQDEVAQGVNPVLRLAPMLLCIGTLSLLSAGWEGEAQGSILSHIFRSSRPLRIAQYHSQCRAWSQGWLARPREYVDEMIRNGWDHVVS